MLSRGLVAIAFILLAAACRKVDVQDYPKHTFYSGADPSACVGRIERKAVQAQDAQDKRDALALGGAALSLVATIVCAFVKKSWTNKVAAVSAGMAAFAAAVQPVMADPTTPLADRSRAIEGLQYAVRTDFQWALSRELDGFNAPKGVVAGGAAGQGQPVSALGKGPAVTPKGEPAKGTLGDAKREGEAYRSELKLKVAEALVLCGTGAPNLNESPGVAVAPLAPLDEETLAAMGSALVRSAQPGSLGNGALGRTATLAELRQGMALLGPVQGERERLLQVLAKAKGSDSLQEQLMLLKELKEASPALAGSPHRALDPASDGANLPRPDAALVPAKAAPPH